MSGAIALIARREVVSRFQQKGFRIGFLLSLAIVVLVCVLPGLFGGDDDKGPTRYDVGVTAQSASLATALRASGDPRFTVRTVAAADARSQVSDGDLDAVLVTPERLVAKTSGAGVVGAVRAAVAKAAVTRELARAGVGASEAQRVLNPPALAVTTTEPASDGQRQAIGIITVIVLFGQLTTFCTWVAMGVVEEKASRVVELLLSAIRPLQLLTGKLLGIGILAAAQTLAIGVVAVVAGTASGTIDIPASAVLVIVSGFVFFLLGFALFASLAAALGSTVSRQEEVSGVLAPVTISLLVCYGASFAATSNPDSTLARLASIVPPFSCIAMPGRVARGGVPLLDLALAVALLALVAAGLLYVAGRIYRASVLHSGTRVSLVRAWRGEAVADIA
ncbi:ABC transporter permease [Jatrophihabitans fulvus]